LTQCIYQAPKPSISLKSIRMWLKKNNRWKIVGGSISEEGL